MRATEKNTKRLSTQAGSIALKKLRDAREKEGYTQMLLDLKDAKFNTTHRHWSLKNGILKISPEGLKEVQTLQEVQDYYHQNLADKPWCQKPVSALLSEIDLTHNPAQLTDGKGYGLPIKTLGKNGPNPAVDPILLLQSMDGSLKVLMIKRFDGSRAFPGGMQESNVLNTCVQELLEEVFSEDLFLPKSPTAQAIQEQKIPEVERIIFNLVANNKEFEKLRPYTEQLKKNLDEEIIDPAEYIRELCQVINQIKELDAHSKEHLIVRMKCCLYEALMPNQYKDFSEFIKNNVIHGAQCINAADPRNTDSAWMVTTPLNIVLQEGNPEFEQLLHSSGLTICGGDDASDAKFIPIERVFDQVYSSHGEILLDSIANMLNAGKLKDTENLSKQLEEIDAKLVGETNRLEGTFVDGMSQLASS